MKESSVKGVDGVVVATDDVLAAMLETVAMSNGAGNTDAGRIHIFVGKRSTWKICDVKDTFLRSHEGKRCNGSG